jgi:hypothetical protein
MVVSEVKPVVSSVFHLTNRERCSATGVTVAHLLEFDLLKFSEFPLFVH